MDLWKIFFLGTLRLNCNWDYDKVHEMANNHRKLRQMLGHSKTDLDSNYALQTIRDNIFLIKSTWSACVFVTAMAVNAKRLTMNSLIKLIIETCPTIHYNQIVGQL